MKTFKQILLLSIGYLFLTQNCFSLTPINQLLDFVAKDKLDSAESLIKENPNLLLQKGDVVDYSNRYFKNITAFQYTLWAYNVCMWNMILKYMSNEMAAAQLNEYENLSHYEYVIHYSFDEILNVQKDFADHCSEVNFPDGCLEKMRKLGIAERQVPAHIVHQVDPQVNDSTGYWYYLSYKVGLGYYWIALFAGGFCTFDWDHLSPIVSACSTSGTMQGIIYRDYTITSQYSAYGPIEYKKLKKNLSIL